MKIWKIVVFNIVIVLLVVGELSFSLYELMLMESAVAPIYWRITVVSLIALTIALVANIIYFKTASKNEERQFKLIKEQGEKLEKALVEAREANRAKTVFLNNMSHDIRTPMNAIIGFTDLLEKSLDDREKSEDYIQKIKKSNDFLLSLINNVLEMSRIESGEVTLDEKPTDFNSIVAALSYVFADAMRGKLIHFEKDIKITHTNIYCDSTKLKEIFQNLFSNAIKYTPEGGKITLSINELPSDKKGYVFYRAVLKDTGIGMSKEFVSRIFEQFSRERNTTEGKIEGTGLGMSIVKKLVDLMDGTITIQSEPNKGTEISVTIPHRIVEAEEPQTEENTQSQFPQTFCNKRILLAEDNDLNAEIAFAILEEMGFFVERATDGAKCVTMLSKVGDYYYDLILMDIQMPLMNGYEATKKIRKMENKIKSAIPIIGLTANAFEEDKRTAIAAGMNGHVAKPINVGDLSGAIQEVLV